MSNRTIFMLAVSAALAAGCQQQGAADNRSAATGNQSAAELPDRNIGQTLAGSAEHSTLVQAVKAAGLEATLAGSQPYTLFAPTNAAFERLPQGTTESLLQADAKGRLTSILTYHIVPGVVTAADLAKAIEQGGGKTELATVGGGRISISQQDGATIITDSTGGTARITRADLLQSNGVVHVVDGVLRPNGTNQ